MRFTLVADLQLVWTPDPFGLGKKVSRDHPCPELSC